MDYTLPIFDRLQDCWNPITEEQLCALEHALEADLPDDYREFLLHFNAPRFSPMVLSRVLEANRHVNDILIRSGYGVIPDDRFMVHDILQATTVYASRIRSTFVPIMDAMGHPVCIDLGEEDYGKVYYWDRTNEGTEGKTDYLIADSFSVFLLSFRPDTELETHVENLPAFQAVERGDRQAVLDYLTDRGKPDLRNSHGWTLLMCAARNSWPKIVDMLLQAGADPNARDPDGWCPLHHAVWGCSLDSIKYLLAAEADAGYRDAKGHNLAQIAKTYHYYRLYYHLAPYMP